VKSLACVQNSMFDEELLSKSVCRRWQGQYKLPSFELLAVAALTRSCRATQSAL